jgi:hypothetical protein
MWSRVEKKKQRTMCNDNKHDTFLCISLSAGCSLTRIGERVRADTLEDRASFVYACTQLKKKNK